MAALTISPTIVGPNAVGKLVALDAASAQAALVGGDAFRVQGKEVLVVNNGSGGAVTVTVAAQSNPGFGGSPLSGNNITLVIAAGKTGVLGPLAASLYADANGLAQVTYSAVTTVTIGLFSFATTS